MKSLRPTLVFLDIFILYIALVLAVLARGTLHNRVIQTASEWLAAHIFIFIPSVIFSLLALYIAGLYDVRTLYDRAKVIPLVIYAQVSAGLFSVLFFYFARTDLTPKLTLSLYIILSIILLVLVRTLTVSSISQRKKQRAVYLSTSGTSTVTDLNFPYAQYLLTQMILSQFQSLNDVQKNSYDAIIYEKELVKNIQDFLIIEKLKKENILCISREAYYEDLHKKVDLNNFDVETFKQIFADKKEHTGHFLFRRFLDILSAIIIMPVSALSLPLVFVLNSLGNKGKIFSIQNRIGVLGSKIKIYKLRTMQMADDSTQNRSNQESLDEAYKYEVTKIGSFLRKTRLDEFPQWINLLLGDISIIGPRADIVGIYNDMDSKILNYRIRTVVPQGLTGWAQVHMPKPPRTIDEYKERLAYELYYIKNRSILLDISIILKTIKTMIARTGA